MPRPKNGYVNAAGEPIPGTHDPISRYMDQTALKMWAYKRGCAGLPLYDRAAIDIGSAVHGMAELDLRGRPDREIEAYAHEALTAPDELRKAFTAFEAFRRWREECHVRAIAQEMTLVSEAHQYGGTPDTIAMINGGLGLIDFKTSPRPYPDHLVALAAHGRLWEENHPDQPLSSYHLLCLPKDGSAFKHHAYADLSRQWELFQLWLAAYRLEKGCAATIKAAPKPKPQPEMPRPRRPARKSAPTEVKRFLAAAAAAPKPAPVIDRPAIAPMPLIAPRAQTMAEILRAYGHVPC